MEFVKNVWTGLDNKKTIIGGVALIGCIIARCVGVDVPELAFTAAIGLCGVGVTHKFVKLQAIIGIVKEEVDKVVKNLPKEEK